jgi:RNA polymerase subunit RPABC4/transcription elongation factor Spt4
MDDTVTCRNCGSVVDEKAKMPDGTNAPCPNCGETARIHNVAGSIVVRASASATATVVYYQEKLLDLAASLINTNDRLQFGICVVIAHIACEVAVQRYLYQKLKANKLEYLSESLEGLFNGFSLIASAERKAFKTITGLDLSKELFWKDYHSSVERRNKIIHTGQIETKENAQITIDVAKMLIARLKY